MKPLRPTWAERPREIPRKVWWWSRWLGNRAAFYGLLKSWGICGRVVVLAAQGATYALATFARFVVDHPSLEAQRMAHAAGDHRARHFERQTRKQSWPKRRRAIELTALTVTVTAVVMVAAPWPVRVALVTALVTAAAWVGHVRPGAAVTVLPALPVTDPARSRVTSDRIVSVFTDAGLPEVMTVGGVHRRSDPDGIVTLVDLRSGTTAPEAIAKRSQIASAWRIDDRRLFMAPAGHAGQVELTVYDRDPMTEHSKRSPFATAVKADTWSGHVLGTLAQGGRYRLVLPGTAATWVGSESGYGKTNLVGLLLAGMVLDPSCARPLIWSGKGEGDFAPYEDLAEIYGDGSSDQDGAGCLDMLRYAIDLRERRGKAIARLRAEHPDLMPTSQITPEVTSNHALGLPLRPVVVDELNLLVETKHGPAIREAVQTLTRATRSGGMLVVVAAQRFDRETMGGARSVGGSRIAFKTRDTAESNLVLGDGMVSAGWDTSKFGDDYRGVAVVRPTGDQPMRGTVQIRTDLLTFSEHRAIAARARCQGAQVARDRPDVVALVLAALEPSERLTDVQTLAGRISVDPERLRDDLKSARVELRPSTTKGGRLCVRRDGDGLKMSH